MGAHCRCPYPLAFFGDHHADCDQLRFVGEHLDQAGEYKPIETPKNSAIGFINAFFAVVTGFALIWHIWWMAGLGLVGAFTTFLLFAFRDEEEVEVSVERIARFERRHQAEAVVP